MKKRRQSNSLYRTSNNQRETKNINNLNRMPIER